jgi:hypothetical protein
MTCPRLPKTTDKDLGARALPSAQTYVALAATLLPQSPITISTTRP